MSSPLRLVVFLGPSCSRKSAQRVLVGDYRPPARRGDVEAAADSGADVIVLIDGYLVHAYPPSPMEVHAVLQKGVHVFGAASLGALRAVELGGHGMYGVGWVYESYRARRIWADDELVTLVHPEGDAAIGIPLVRVRFALEHLMADGTVSAEQHALLIGAVRDTYYEERTESHVRALAAQCGLSPQTTDRMLSERFDVKRLDTLACLAHVEGRVRRGLRARMPPAPSAGNAAPGGS